MVSVAPGVTACFRQLSHAGVEVGFMLIKALPDAREVACFLIVNPCWCGSDCVF